MNRADLTVPTGDNTRPSSTARVRDKSALHRYAASGAVGGLLILMALAASGCAGPAVTRDPGRASEARAVAFLSHEVPRWRAENGCFSCHNNGDAARALYEAARSGYGIPRRVLAETTGWLVRPGRWEENQGDPGFSDQRLANVQFAAALLAAHDSGQVRDPGPLIEAARKVAADQDRDGAWPIEPQNPVGSPATLGTPIATLTALRILERAQVPGTEAAIRKARAWLCGLRPDNLPASAAVLLATAREDSGEVRTNYQESLRMIRRSQTREGGWGPYADSPAEPFDTAIVLLALSEQPFDPELGQRIRLGRNFLVAQQNLDGSWPATTRPPRGDSYAQTISTTGWATLALLATRPIPTGPLKSGSLKSEHTGVGEKPKNGSGTAQGRDRVLARQTARATPGFFAPTPPARSGRGKSSCREPLADE